MPDYPKAPSALRAPDAADVIILGGIERLTHRLRAGDHISDPADVIGRLIKRLEALKEAAEARNKVIED